MALRDLGEEAARSLIGLEITLGHTCDMALFEELLSANVCYRISDLTVGGAEMKALGLVGAEIGSTLDLLLTAVIEGRVENSREKLIEFVKTIVRNK